MSTEIGTVKTIIGTVIAQATDGSQRILKAGDTVLQNETILTGDLGAVEIELIDGSLVDLGRSSTTVLDPAVFDLTPAQQNSATENVEAIQQSILEGEDPTQNQDPTAAGEELIEGNEGTIIVPVQHLAPEITPTSGFDTTGINFAFPEGVERVDDELLASRFNNTTPNNFINDLPTTRTNSPIAFDDDTLGGNRGGINDDNPDNLNLAGILAHDFGNDGPGTILLSDTGAPAGFVYTLNGDGTVMTVSQDGTDVLQFSLTDTTSGEYTVTQLAPINHPEGLDENNQLFDITYIVTDGNGDSVTGNVSISADDDTPVVTSNDNPLIRLDDDALADGNPGGRGDNPDSQNTSGTLAHSFGSDGPGTLLLLDTGAPAGFVYTLNGDGTVMTVSQDGTDVLQFSLTDTTSGDYTVTQLAPIDHRAGGRENNQNFNINYQVTDGDGDAANGRIRISADDDSPVLIIEQDSVNDIAYSFTITNFDEVSSAGHNSSYGYYIKDADGNPTTGVVVWDNVKDIDTTPVSVSGQFTPDQVGFFIIPNGDRVNGSLTDNTEVTFQFVNGQWQAFDAGQPLNGTGAPAFFDNANLNKDNESHVEDNQLAGNQNWEDLPIVSGDADYNDLNVNVEWTAVSASGDSIETASFGADGPFGADGSGSIDFTLEDVTILGNLTSNGKELTFQARDTDSDGQNDTLFGSTEDGDVLSIEGILRPEEFEIELFAPVESSNNGSDDVAITANINITDGDGDSAIATLNFNLDINQITETATPLPD